VRLGARWRGAGVVAWRVLADAVLGRPGDVAGRAELRRGELGQSGSEAGPEASGAGGLLLARGRAGSWSKAGQAVCGVAERAGAGAWGRAKRDGELVGSAHARGLAGRAGGGAVRWCSCSSQNCEGS
jgi:hypothetical protein